MREADILIIGGGTAGLATAAFLRQRMPARTSILLLERGPSFVGDASLGSNGCADQPLVETSRTDYGNVLASNGVSILKLLGMDNAALELDGCELAETLVRPQDNPDDVPATHFPCEMLFGSPSVFCRRSKLLSWLHRRCVEPFEDREEVHMLFDRKILELNPREGQAVDDKGEVYRGRLLICADGIGKVGRAAIRDANAKLPEQNGEALQARDDECIVQCAYMGIVPADALRQRTSISFLVNGDDANSTLANWTYDSSSSEQADDMSYEELAVAAPETQRRIILYPVDARGNHQLFAMFPVNDEILSRFGRRRGDGPASPKDTSLDKPTSRPGMLRGVDSRQARHDFAAFHDDLSSLLELHPTIDLCLIRDTEPLTSWTAYDKAVLIGDAAHATVPHTGQGSAQALEDAEVLSFFLSQACKGGDFASLDDEAVHRSFEAFEKARIERAREVQDTARLTNGVSKGLAELDLAAYYSRIMTWKGAEHALASGRI